MWIKIGKIQLDSEKSKSSFEIKDDTLPVYSLENYYFSFFFNNWSELLLCEISGLDL